MGDPSPNDSDDPQGNPISELRLLKGSRRGSKTTVECRAGTRVLHQASFCLDEPSERDAFIDAILSKAPSAASLRDQLASQLLELASTRSVDGSRKDDKTTEVLSVVRPICARLFTAADPQRTPFVDILVHGHRETHPIEGEHFRGHIRQLFFKSSGRGITEAVARDVQMTLAAEARASGLTNAVHVRIAAYDDRVLIDVCDNEWQVLEVDAAGYRLLPQAPRDVRFRRNSSMRPLPIPSSPENASIDTLRKFLRCRRDQDEDFRLTVLWMVASLRGRSPIPIMNVNGQQGTGKTSHSRAIQELIDPSSIGLDSLPRDERNLMIAAKATYLLAYDNVSAIPSWLSDAMCRIATGAGWRVRKNYTDEDFTQFAGSRPQLINGIPDVTSRPDFAERSIVIRPATLAGNERRTEDDFWKEYNKAKPQMFAALLLGVSAALKTEGAVHIPNKPRMADFAVVAVAAGSAFGWDQRSILHAYAQNQRDQVEAQLATDLVAEAVRLLVESRDGAIWENTPTQLFAELERTLVANRLGRDSNWPSSVEKMSSHLRRILPSLNQIGIAIAMGRTRTGRFIKVSRSVEQKTFGDVTDLPSQPDYRHEM